MIRTALLICIENTFWNTGITKTDANFLDLFKASFAFYVESGTKEIVEAEIDLLTRSHQLKDGPATEEFKAMFCKMVIEHFLPERRSHFSIRTPHI